MGKGEIQSYIGSGRYSVTLNYAGRSKIEAYIAAIDAQIAKLQTKLSGMEDGPGFC